MSFTMPNKPAEVHDEGAEMSHNPKTGASKQKKKARFDLVPPEVEWKLAELYGRGSELYSHRNWERGFDWSLSYAAARRHLNQFWAGEIMDEQTNAEHVICAAWHCFTLSQFSNGKQYEEYDDRPHTFIPGQQELFPEATSEQQELFPSTTSMCPSCEDMSAGFRKACQTCYGMGIVDTK